MAQTEKPRAAGSRNTKRLRRPRENPEFFFDSDILGAIERIIERAEQCISIVSPYNDFPLPPRVKDALERAAKRNVAIRAVCRKNREQEEREYWGWLYKIGAEVYIVERLHAKIYCNESYGVITSMNLLESSIIGSKEVGIGLTKPDQIHKYVNSLAKHEKFAPSKPPNPESTVAEAGPDPSDPPKAKPKQERGFCIRCREDIPYNQEEPLCTKDRRTWNSYKNRDFPEKHCHLCGHERANISFAKPLCRSCYRKVTSAT